MSVYILKVNLIITVHEADKDTKIQIQSALELRECSLKTKAFEVVFRVAELELELGYCR